MFDFEPRLNPQSESFPVTGPAGSVVFKLRPFETQQAFDAHRFQLLRGAGMIADADEEQFKIGLKRIIGWSGVLNPRGEEVEFSEANFLAFTRMPEAIGYIQEVGLHTLVQANVVTLLEKKVESNDSETQLLCEASPTSSETP